MDYKEIYNQALLLDTIEFRRWISILMYKQDFKSKDIILAKDLIEMIDERLVIFFDINIDIIKNKYRPKKIAAIRQAVHYIMHVRYNLSSTLVGRLLLRDHADILHSCKTIANLLSTNDEIILSLIDFIEYDYLRESKEEDDIELLMSSYGA